MQEGFVDETQTAESMQHPHFEQITRILQSHKVDAYSVLKLITHGAL